MLRQYEAGLNAVRRFARSLGIGGINRKVEVEGPDQMLRSEAQASTDQGFVEQPDTATYLIPLPGQRLYIDTQRPKRFNLFPNASTTETKGIAQGAPRMNATISKQ
jgi:hypothetical protein